MKPTTFDTHTAIKRLIKTGYKENQAEEVVAIMQESREVDFSKLVTKDFLRGELAQLENSISKLEIRMMKWMASALFIASSAVCGITYAMLQHFLVK